MTYAQAVARGRMLLTRSDDDQWELAELTYQRTTGEDAVTIVTWAADLGCRETHAKNLRRMWDRFGQSTADRSNRTFAELYVLANMSKERAAQLVANANKRNRRVTTIHNERRHRDPFEDAREYMRDRRRARKLLKDPKIREIVERELGESPDRAQPRPQRPLPDLEYAGELSATRDRLSQMLGQMLDRKLSKKERKSVSDSLDDLQVILGWMGSYVRSGDRSFEDALDALLADVAVPSEPSPGARTDRRTVSPAQVEPAPPLEVVAAREPAGPRRRRTPPKVAEPVSRPPRRRRAS